MMVHTMKAQPFRVNLDMNFLHVFLVF